MGIFSKRLRKASFKGVSFEVDSATLTFGRRTVTHEYPQRDVPYVEDLGKATRTFSIQAFVIGDDYIARAKRLLKVLEESGPGDLIHPWLGKLKVHAIDTPSVTWNSNLGIATFSISFLEPGELVHPNTEKSWGTIIREEADKLYDDAIESFGLDFDINDLNGVITDIANGSYQDILGCLSDSKFSRVFDLGDNITELINTASSALEKKPTDFANELLNSIGIANTKTKIQNWSDALSSINDLFKDNRLFNNTNKLKNTSPYISNRELTTIKASAALEVLVRDISLANLAGASTLVATDLDSENSSSSFDNTKDVAKLLDLRNSTLESIEKEMLLLGYDEHIKYGRLETIYSAIYTDLTTRAINASRIISYSLNESVPACVLAYDLYEDATRDVEIVKRNDIANAMFLPLETLKISNS